MIPRTFPSIIEAFQTKMVVYVLPSITGLRAWIDYIPVKGVVTESATLANTYANGGYQVVKSLDSLTGLQAWIGYIPVYEDAAYNKPWSTDAGGYIPVGGLFSIPSLFASGAPGVWYDPSDYSTLFQDSAGTTPVTAVEQPVGLMLDKSKGLVLGPELVTNGDFSNGTTGWSAAQNAGTATITTDAGRLKVAGDAAATYPRAFQNYSLTVGKRYLITVTFDRGTATEVYLSPEAGTSVRSTAASGVLEIRYVATAIAFNVSAGIWDTGGQNKYAFFDNISVKELPGNHAFQSTSASRPVLRIDGNGKYFLRFDGVDDSLSTNSISFTSTDKMSVFAGVRKFNSGTFQIIAELGTDSYSNNGSFGIFPTGPVQRSESYGTFLRGSDIGYAGFGTYVSPITNVLALSYNIAASGITNEITARINGIAVGYEVTGGSAGTGNYGNYPLYIGRRNNASLPFNGQIYSIVIVGKAVTAGELSSTETYVNQKTGAY